MNTPALTARPFGLALLFDRRRLRFTLLFSTGIGLLTFLSTLLTPWAVLTALVRQKDALARHQALAFELEKSQRERLRLVYGEEAALRISALEPRGVCAEIELPVRGVPA